LGKSICHHKLSDDVGLITNILHDTTLIAWIHKETICVCGIYFMLQLVTTKNVCNSLKKKKGMYVIVPFYIYLIAF